MRTSQTYLSDFNNQSSAQRGKKKAKETKPFPIRFTEDERAYLEEKAGRRPLGAYCREILLANYTEKRRSQRKPSMSDEQYTKLLSALGESHLSSNLNQLAKHANMGTIDVSDDVERELHDAYLVIIEMRKALFMALGLKV